MEFSFEQVAAVAESLTAAGVRPSLRGIRERLGTGSLATIQRHLAAWNQGRREMVTTQLILGSEIQRAILLEIERQVAEARSKLEEELGNVKADRDALMEEGEKMNDRLSSLSSQTDELTATLQHQAGTIEQLRLELERARENAAQGRDAAEQVRGNLAKAEIRLESVERLEGDVALLRAKIETERDGRINAEKEAIALKSRLEAFEEMSRKK
jgi:chromosome segregation ATPase